MTKKLSTQDKNAINDLLRFKKNLMEAKKREMTNDEAREILTDMRLNCEHCTCYDCRRGFGSCGRCRRCQDGDCDKLEIDCMWKVVDDESKQIGVQSTETGAHSETVTARA